MRLLLLAFAGMLLMSCSPVSNNSRELPTKYPDSATMGAAEDASKTKFDENSFNR
jgi:hypothetical protein